jgi:hypothetical protein
MNLRYLVRPLAYGGTAGAVVGALGMAAALTQSVSVYLLAVIYIFVGLTAVGLLLGASSFNENSESPETVGDEGDILSAPTEAGPERRLTLACFGAVLALAGLLGGVYLGG